MKQVHGWFRWREQQGFFTLGKRRVVLESRDKGRSLKFLSSSSYFPLKYRAFTSPETWQAAEYVLCCFSSPLTGVPSAHLAVSLGFLGNGRMGLVRDARGGAGDPQLSASPAGKGHLLQPVTPPREPAAGVLPLAIHFYATGCQRAFVWTWVHLGKGSHHQLQKDLPLFNV